MGAVASTNIITDGLISCWDPANRRSYPGTGIVLTDLVGGNNAELTNMGSAGSGFFSEKGGIIAFDGSNDSLELNDDLEILPHGTNPFTINMWVRPESGIGKLGTNCLPISLSLSPHHSIGLVPIVGIPLRGPSIAPAAPKDG